MSVAARPKNRMPPWIPRAFVLGVITFMGTLALLWSLGRLRGLLINLLLSLFLAFALEPAVVFLVRRGWKRGLATGVVFISAGVLALLFVVITLPPLVSQTVNLVSEIPEWLDGLTDWANDQFGLTLSLSNLTESLSDLQGTLQNYAGTLANSLLGLGTRVLNIIVQLLTIGLFTFYLVADGPRWRRVMLSMLRPTMQKEIARMWDIAIDKTGGYVYSRALLALASALFTYISLRIIGVPFALPLAIWVGVVSQFIPAVGTYLAAIAPTLIALTESITTAIVVLGILVIYQQIENYFLSPRITEGTMSMHPAVAFGSVLAGSALLGAPGALIALPAVATLQAFISTFIERYKVEEEMLEHKPAKRATFSKTKPEDPGEVLPKGEEPVTKP